MFQQQNFFPFFVPPSPNEAAAVLCGLFLRRPLLTHPHGAGGPGATRRNWYGLVVLWDKRLLSPHSRGEAWGGEGLFSFFYSLLIYMPSPHPTPPNKNPSSSFSPFVYFFKNWLN